MFNLELSVVGHHRHAVVALCGELDLADAPALASHLIACHARARRRRSPGCPSRPLRLPFP
jgi:hypothetical protein